MRGSGPRCLPERSCRAPTPPRWGWAQVYLGQPPGAAAGPAPCRFVHIRTACWIATPPAHAAPWQHQYLRCRSAAVWWAGCIHLPHAPLLGGRPSGAARLCRGGAPAEVRGWPALGRRALLKLDQAGRAQVEASYPCPDQLSRCCCASSTGATPASGCCRVLLNSAVQPGASSGSTGAGRGSSG